MYKGINMITNKGLGGSTNKFHEFWGIYIFCRVYSENRQGGPTCQIYLRLSVAKRTTEDSKRLGSTPHQSGGRDVARLAHL